MVERVVSIQPGRRLDSAVGSVFCPFGSAESIFFSSWLIFRPPLFRVYDFTAGEEEKRIWITISGISADAQPLSGQSPGD